VSDLNVAFEKGAGRGVAQIFNCISVFVDMRLADALVLLFFVARV